MYKYYLISKFDYKCWNFLCGPFKVNYNGDMDDNLYPYCVTMLE